MKGTTLTFSFLQPDNSVLSCHQIIYSWICLQEALQRRLIFFHQSVSTCSLQIEDNFSKETQAQKGSSYKRLNTFEVHSLKCL